jgi:2,4-diaminopentanoate dehydrogenase
MERNLRIAQYGCGKMSVHTMRYAMEKGAEIVCAFGRSPQTIGKDIGEIAGVGKTGVLVQDSKDAVAILKEKRPDACIITTGSLMQEIKGALMDCAESTRRRNCWTSWPKRTVVPFVAPDFRMCSGEI